MYGPNTSGVGKIETGRRRLRRPVLLKNTGGISQVQRHEVFCKLYSALIAASGLRHQIAVLRTSRLDNGSGIAWPLLPG